jgi:hypothetical protein
MRDNFQNTISFYKSKETKISESITIQDVLKKIKTGDNNSTQIISLRNEQDKATKDQIKGCLPMVTFSGLFGESRKREQLLEYSNFICLDIDKLEKLDILRTKIESDKFTSSCFLSPSGNGLKVLIKVSGTENDHLRLFHGLQLYYKQNFNVEIDKSCKDVSRGAFLSYDPDIFINGDSIEWGLKNILDEKLKNTHAYIAEKIPFDQGNRNNHVFEFAISCKAQKISHSDCLEYAKCNYLRDDFSFIEIDSTVKNVYLNQYSTDISKQFNKEYKVSSWDIAEEFLNQKYELRYNLISNKPEYRIANSDDPFNEINEDSIYRDMQKNNVSFSLNKLRSLLSSDFVPNFDPFLSYFKSLVKLESDANFDYIDYLASFVKTDNDIWFKTQFKKMLVRSVACALDISIFNKQVLILVHAMQNSGKSTFCRFLCPPQLSDYFTENISTDKDSLIALANNFIVNMDELATLNRAEINTLKSMISRNNVNVRLPYGRRQINLPRRANFVGSTNKDEFLTDETGSVRWLCIELIDKIDFSYKKRVDINLVWKQAYQLYNEDYLYEMTQEELDHNELRNKKYQNSLTEYELIQQFFMPCSEKQKSNFITSTEILILLKNKEELKALNITQANISKALRMLGYKSESCYLETYKQSRKGFFMIERN